MKKPPSIQISLPNPCQQDWDNMPRVGNGFHCADCKKVVVDFTRMTDAAIIDFLQRERLTCGVFREDQLDRDITLPIVRKAPFGAKWLFSLLLFFGWIKESIAQQASTVSSQLHQLPDSTHSSGSVNAQVKKDVPVMQVEKIIIDHPPSVRILGGVPPREIRLLKDLPPSSGAGERNRKRNKR